MTILGWHVGIIAAIAIVLGIRWSAHTDWWGK